MPKEKWLNKLQIRDVRCPRCWAKPGQACTDENGNRGTHHAERVKYAVRVNR